MRLYPLAFTLIVFSASIHISNSRSQTIGAFNSIEPAAQTQRLVLPASHTFQSLIRTGTPLNSGGNLGSNLDFTGYVPIAGSSTNGYLSISSETGPAECAILSINYDVSYKLWRITNSGKVAFPAADLGYTSTFCSGTVTPKNTIMVCEEIVPGGDANGDGYEDVGWITEIDPATRSVINQDATGGVDKLWAMGRQTHENVCIRSDQSVAYWGADNGTNGFMYKFVPAVAGNFSEGTLYVLETTTALGTGTWKPVANTTKTERNNTIALSGAAGAYNFNRIEDVEIGPDGKVYFASTATGRIYRFTDAGTTVNSLGVFVENMAYDVDGAGPYAPVMFEWPDNLAFDGEGNLWVLQDGGDNHIWVVAPTHTTAAPAIKVFANTPAGSEPTGITFSPDYKFMFLSIQHPSSSNTASQTDGSMSVVFNENTTIVIARQENLGATLLPLKNVSLTLFQKSNGIEVAWATVDNTTTKSYEVERSTDGTNFTKIGSQNASLLSNTSYSYLDNNLPVTSNVFYRLKQCDAGNQCIYSETKSLKITTLNSLKVYPSASSLIRVWYSANTTSDVLMYVYTNNGSEVYREKRKVTQGVNDFNITIENLRPGMYVLKIDEGTASQSLSFVKR